MSGIESDLSSLMTDTVQIATRTSVDGYSKPSYGTPTSYAARVVKKTRQVYLPTGEVLVSSAVVYLVTDPGVQTHDQITLPDGSQPRILTVRSYPDENGAYYAEVST